MAIAVVVVGSLLNFPAIRIRILGAYLVRHLCMLPLTYLLIYAHRSRRSIGHLRPLAIVLVLGCSGHSSQVGPLLFQRCISTLPPNVARPVSLPLSPRVPGQGLTCSAGCWLLEGVSDPVPLPPQYLIGHWFLSRSLPQIFILDILLPLDLRAASLR